MSGPLISQLGTAIGGNADQTARGLAGAVPTILGGLLNKASLPSGADELIGAMAEGNHDGLLGNLGAVLGGGDATQALAKADAGLLPMILGDRNSAVTDLVGALSGMNRSSSSSLIGMLAPLAVGFLTRQLRASGGLSPAASTDLLQSQQSSIVTAAPPGLASALGMPTLASASAAAVAAAPKRGGSGAKWAIGLALALAAFLTLRSCQGPRNAAPAEPAPTPAVSAPVEAPAAPVAEVAAPDDGLTAFDLADGTTVRAAADGLESQLLAFIRDAAKPVDKTTWFTMSGLELVTGSAELSEKSNAQLDAVAAILKAYPAVALKIGGYTDNVGNPASNLKLSAARAGSTVAALVARGADAARLEGEGFGDQFPVADIATAEGRQRNCRIDVRVTAK